MEESLSRRCEDRMVSTSGNARFVLPVHNTRVMQDLQTSFERQLPTVQSDQSTIPQWYRLVASLAYRISPATLDISRNPPPNRCVIR